MDRTAASLDERINVAVTGMATLSGKPSCLILDEVDGIAHSGSNGGVLGRLLKISSTPWKERGAKRPIQKRPVVCICNNPWEKELRPLRDVATHIKVDSVLPIKLVDRLVEICSMEGVNADTSCLRELCTLSGGDIRSCLFTLQFLSQKHKGKRLTPKQISGVGLKDKMYSYFDVMEAVFHTDDAKAAQTLRRIENGGVEMTADAYRQMDQTKEHKITGQSNVLVRHMTSGHPELERLLEGCFEEYLDVRYADYDMKKTAALTKRASEFNTFQALSREKMFLGCDYMYGPQLIIQYHDCCRTVRTVAKKRWAMPKKAWENRKKLEKTQEIVEAYICKNDIKRLYYASMHAFVLDYLPAMLAVLNPYGLRHSRPAALVALQTQQDPEEKRLFDSTVAQYIAEHLSFSEIDVYDKTKGTPFGSTKKIAKISPDLDSISFYGKQYRKFFMLPDDVKRRLWKAVKEAEIAQKVDTAMEQPGEASTTSTPALGKSMFGVRVTAPKQKPTKEAVPEKKKGPSTKAQPPSELKGLAKGKAVMNPTSIKRDMFGNIIKKKAPVKQVVQTGVVNPLSKHKMFDKTIGCKYDQNRGFTNAVRKKGSWSDWL